jgi:hypothetical protein
MYNFLEQSTYGSASSATMADKRTGLLYRMDDFDVDGSLKLGALPDSFQNTPEFAYVAKLAHESNASRLIAELLQRLSKRR